MALGAARGAAEGAAHGAARSKIMACQAGELPKDSVQFYVANAPWWWQRLHTAVGAILILKALVAVGLR